MQRKHKNEGGFQGALHATQQILSLAKQTYLKTENQAYWIIDSIKTDESYDLYTSSRDVN
ncbi:hypothetical protein CHS0354_032357, partial [Potamilus streckersoni]